MATEQQYPELSESFRLQRLARPKEEVRVVIDTDTFNEIDDQFAVAYGLLSGERMNIEAFYAAPFDNHLSSGPGDGMEKSYEELQKILGIMGVDTPVYRGSTAYMPAANEPVESDAARNLVERVLASADDDPLYVLAIGAITNVASAIVMEPKIIEKMVLIWLGGTAHHWPHTREFNLEQDVHASRIVFDCGVPLVHIPCAGVTTHLTTTLSEMRDYVKDQGSIGAYLYDTFKNCADDHFAYSRVIWDMTTVAYLINADWLPNELVHSPYISEDFRWSFDASRHFIRYVHHVHRDPIFKDLFQKLANYHKE